MNEHAPQSPESAALASEVAVNMIYPYLEEPTLSEDMALIDSRYLRDVSLVLRDGYDDERRIQFTEREDIVALRDALTEALAAIESDRTIRESEATP